MKEIIRDPGRESSSTLRRSSTSQFATPMGIAARCKHLCVVCALRKHDFEARAPEPTADEYDAVLCKSTDRWTFYRSVYHVASQGIECTDCGASHHDV
jgi:hypothetical protein